MDFALLPPEVNSGRMYAGPGAAPMLAAATAWDLLADELHAAGAGYETVIADLAIDWAGPSATSMTAAVSPYATWMHTTATQAEQAASQAKTAAAAYQAAFAMTVPPPVIAANRSQLLVLLATNFLGQNAAAIAATEAHYAQMWAQDATAMYTYAGTAAAAAVLNPFGVPPQPANPTVAGGQVAASVGSQLQAGVTQLAVAPHALQVLAAPAAATAPSSTAPAAPSALLTALTPTLTSTPALAAAYEALAIELFSVFIIDSVGTFGVDAIGTFVIDVAGVAIGALEASLLPAAGLASWSSPALAGIGQAALVGKLSVPAAWTVAASAAAEAGGALTAAGTAAASAAAGGASAVPFAGMAAAGLAGHALAVSGRGSRRSAVPTTRKAPVPPQPALPPRPPGGPITSVSAKLRQLAKLRDLGFLSEEKFTAKKRRLLSQQSSP